MNQYDSKRELLQALASQAMVRQDHFLNQFIGKPRELGISNKNNISAEELLKLTYQKLLQNVRAEIEAELETLI